MDWICATCGKPNGANDSCPDCGHSRPSYGAQRALLGPVLNVNYGVINYNLAPVAVLAQEPSSPSASPGHPALPAARGAFTTVGLLVMATIVSIVVFLALLVAIA